MKKLLLVAHIFPPKGGGGVQRTSKHVKYLPRFGWEPVVLTERADSTGRKMQKDTSLLEEVSHARVYRTTSLGSIAERVAPSTLGNLHKRLFCIPDRQIGWFPSAYSAGKRIIRKEGIDAIYSTSVPFTSHLIAYCLHRKTNLPWIADFRDPWTMNIWEYSSQFRRVIEERMEHAVLKKATRVIGAWDGIRDGFLDKYDDIPPENITVITNGFDPEDFTGVEPDEFSKFTLLFSGAVYEPKVPLTPLIEGLKQLDPGILENLQVLLVGTITPHEKKKLHESSLHAIEHIPYLPHRELFSLLQGAHVLLLMRDIEIRTLPGKIFEYFAMRKPILGIIPTEGDAAALLRRTETGMAVPPDDPDAIGKAIENFYRQWKEGSMGINPESRLIDDYRREVLTGKLAGILDEICG